MVYVSRYVILNFNYDEEQKAYFCVFTDEILNALVNEEENRVINAYAATCTENKARYSKAEVITARHARDVMRRLCYPSDAG